VTASNPDGAWSEIPLSLPVSVLPAPWLSIWAKLLYAVAIVLAGLAVWNAQRRKLRLASAARDRLEREVAARTGELRERNEELGRVSRAKSEFLSRMSHEIRTPMNGVIGMTELLGRTELSRRQTELVGAIHGSARALMQILNEILDLARVESGKLALETIEFDLRELLEESVTTFAAQAAEKGLELTVSPPVDPDCRVLGDLAASGRGKVVARIEVSDTGIGMAAETVARVFEPFAQADESTTRQYGGTGLGLAICHQLIELMGGTLTCESELGIGSTFSLELPFERVAPSGELRPPVAMEGLRARVVSRRVGLVRAVLRQARAWGVEAEEAEDLHTPASEAKPGSGEILIVDADSQPAFLDGLSPREVGRPTGSLVILATTGNVVVQRLEERFGPEAIVAKPVRTAALRSALARAGGRSTALADADAVALKSAAPGRLAGHVLVVEDNPVNAAVAQGMLAELGCTATVVNGGRRAVACAVAERFDLILMDLHMPDLDGITATGLIRRAETGIRVPIVALTADAAHAHRDKCQDAGMDDFLGKPFTLRELHARLSRWLPVAPVGPALQADSGRAASVAAGLDLSAIAGIRALDRPDRPRLLPKLVEMFDSSSTERLRELGAALDRGDLNAARAVAHSLKSACANVGAGKLARLAQALERACAASDSQQARLLAEEVFVTHRPTLDALRHEALEDSA